jgi:hypothetical protein
MTNLYQQLQTPATPDLPNPQDKYERLTVAQTNAALRTYFTKVSNFLSSLASPRGARFINAPYGAFQDSTDQTATANTATVMTFNTTDYSNGVSIVSNSKITVAHAGIYNLQFSAQFQNTDTQLHDVSIWLRQDASGAGTDVAGSTGLVSVPNSHGGVDGHVIAGWNYFVSLNANDFVEIWWSTTSTNVSIQAYGAGTSPTRPTTASVIATMSFVSNLSA